MLNCIIFMILNEKCSFKADTEWMVGLLKIKLSSLEFSSGTGPWEHILLPTE